MTNTNTVISVSNPMTRLKRAHVAYNTIVLGVPVDYAKGSRLIWSQIESLHLFGIDGGRVSLVLTGAYACKTTAKHFFITMEQAQALGIQLADESITNKQFNQIAKLSIDGVLEDVEFTPVKPVKHPMPTR
ncbi:hypothetical protein ACG30_14835 [Listeria monocytogenes]|nr:hypothetical protein [Listeria monocytogenes]